MAMPTMPSAAACFEAAFVRACTLDVEVRKPGNVSLASAGHGMQAAQFLDSARAAAPALSQPGRCVGYRLEAAVQATLAVAGCNTNLGILLLAAPIAVALERIPQAPTPLALRSAIGDVLAALDLDDARGAFRAIAAARPGGLGEVEAADVRAAPTVTLREAMQLAAGRDSIARQYSQGDAELFDTGLAALEAAEQGPGRRDATAAVQRVFLAWLAGWPDSHIVRKHGEAMAQTVMAQASAWQARAQAGDDLDADAGFAAWDAELKARQVNPGTSADLTVATLLIAGVLHRDRPGLVSRTVSRL